MVRVLFLLVWVLLEAPLPRAEAPPDVAAGMALAREGDFEAAVIALDAAVRRLESEGAPGAVRALAQLHLGIAYLELEQEPSARARFAEALAADPGLTLDPRAFSAQVMRVFEAVRRERALTRAASPPAPGSSRKGLLIAGGVAVVGGGVAALAGGGGGSNTNPTTTTVPATSDTQPTTLPGAPTTTTTATTTTVPGSPTTSTTLSAPTTTVPGTPTTTTPTTTTTLPPTTTTTLPATTTTTTPPPCTYNASPSTVSFTFAGGTGTCTIDTRAACPYTARSTASFLRIQSGASGTGDGVVQYAVDANTGAARAAFIAVDQNPDARCEVRQAGVLFQPTVSTSAPLRSTLELAGGSGQVVVDGRQVSFVERAATTVNSDAAPQRVEATVVSAQGSAGSWLFDLPAGRGAPRVIAGQVLEISESRLRFALQGRPGERVVFVWSPRPQ
jgi:hypothetical protein